MADIVRADVEARGLRVFEVSAMTREGLRPLTYHLGELVEAHRATLAAPSAERIVIRPPAVNEIDFTVERDPEDPDAFLVRGTKPERWIRQTDFTNDEAVGFLADRLAKLGVEKALAEAGAHAGDAVTVGDVTFDWEPTVETGAGTPMTGRGTDVRLERTDRPAADERLAAKKTRRQSTEYGDWYIEDDAGDSE
jgi:GTP-binding protein